MLNICLTFAVVKKQVVKFLFQELFHDGGIPSEMLFFPLFASPLRAFFLTSNFYSHNNDPLQ